MQLKPRLFILTLAVLLLLVPAAMADRGSDGQLRMLYWQAPSILNPFLSGGTKDIHAASLVIENGGVAADLLSITWRLWDDVVWSDGSPFTAADVAFTAAYCMDPEGACSAASRFQDVKAVEAIDSHTVRVTFKVPMPFPYVPFVGSVSPVIQEEQFSACTGARAHGRRNAPSRTLVRSAPAPSR